ncbi:hypothetical protein BH10PLA1_BH10PLA1_17250 [soil metagenome]
MSTAPTTPLPPDTIGDFRILTALSATTFRALGPGDKAVVLKLCDVECLQRGKLHPGIHARMSRVRELAHPGVANLHSVERDGPYLFAVWDDVPGLPIDQYVRTHQPSSPSLARMARELILVVESLHALGLVHGRIAAGNVIVAPRGNIRLTHVSPLLYDDPAIDEAATLDLLNRLVQSPSAGQPLRDAVQHAIDQKLPLRSLATTLSVSLDLPATNEDQSAPDSDSGVRWSTLGLAISFAVLGLAVAWVIYRTVG